MNILVTGGAGYIGSHAVVELSRNGYRPTILDSFTTSDRSVVERLSVICGHPIPVLEGDVRNLETLRRAFRSNEFVAVLHFAGLKSVPESIKVPLDYYEVNVHGTLNVLRAALESTTKKFIFSSSATVYGPNEVSPVTEESNTQPSNPYGWSKLHSEQLLRDAAIARPDISVGILRYFNPVGSHESNLIGESPVGEPGNLMPLLTRVASGLREKLFLYGDDYPTPDGTGLRDFIHVSDLAAGHVATLRYLMQNSGAHTFNLGTGSPHSVRELLDCFVRVTGAIVPVEVAARRAGDVAACWANVGRARDLLKWVAKNDLTQMCESAWNWHCRRNC